MIRTLVLSEIGLAAGIFLVAAGEYAGLVIARRQGLTKNVSRLVTHGLLMVLTLAYVAMVLWWWSAVRAPEALTGVGETPTVNWAYLLLGAMIGALTSYELWQHASAMLRGLSHSVTRLITHLAMVVLMIVMLGINLARWQAYLDALESGYRDGLANAPAAAGAEPVDAPRVAEPGAGETADEGDPSGQ